MNRFFEADVILREEDGVTGVILLALEDKYLVYWNDRQKAAEQTREYIESTFVLAGLGE